MKFYILDDNYYMQQVTSSEAFEWKAKEENTHLWQVNVTEYNNVKVSTVFLMFDHGHGATPLFYETMVFGGQWDGYQLRYETRKEAQIGHQKVVQDLWGVAGETFKMKHKN